MNGLRFEMKDVQGDQDVLRPGLPPDTSPLGPAASRRGGATPRLHRDATSFAVFGAGAPSPLPCVCRGAEPPEPPTVRLVADPAGLCFGLFGALLSATLLVWRLPAANATLPAGG